MNQDLISVVIPCYRQAHLLPVCVQSCLDQTYPHVEIIVVDDGSPDNVSKALQRFGSRIKLVRQKNQGLSSARNTGLGVANGRYVKFLDSDDWLLPDCLEKQYLSLCLLDKHLSAIGYRIWVNELEKYARDVYPDFGKLSHALCYVNTGPPHTYLFPIDAVREINGFDTSDRVKGGHEDYDLLCRLALKGYEVVALHTIGCVYRRSPNSMSTNVEGMRRSRRKVWLHFVEKLLQEENDVLQLLHILGGYALRLGSKDIRYEAVHLLEQIVTRFEFFEGNIPRDLVLEICRHALTIRSNLPNTLNAKEAYLKKLSLDLSDRLVKLAISDIDKDDLLEFETKATLIRLIKSKIASYSHNQILVACKNQVDRFISQKVLSILRSLLG